MKYKKWPRMDLALNGYYYAFVDGRRISLREKVFTRAKEKYDRLIGGEDITAKPLYFSDAVKLFIAGPFLSLARTTRARYRWSLENKLVPYFKFHTIRKIRPQDVQEYIDTRKKSGTAANTLLKEIFALSAVLSWCVRTGKLQRNPVREVEKPSRKALVRPNYTPAEHEINALLKHLHKSVVTFALTLANTGCRVNELRMANISDFDYGRGTLRIIRKGDKADVLFLNDMIRDRIMDDLVLRMSRADSRELKPDEPLFLNRYGTRLMSIKRSLKFACERARIPHITHHSFRHGYATILYEQGWTIPQVANCLGNSIQVCTDIYVKWQNRKQKEMARKVQIGNLPKI